MIDTVSSHFRVNHLLHLALLGPNVVEDIFPSSQVLDGWLDQLPAEPLHPSLSVCFPLIPPSAELPPIPDTTFDSRGLSRYGRVIEGLLQLFGEHRKLAKQHVWALRHFQAIKVYAQDLLNVASERSHVFHSTTTPSMLEGIINRVDQITAYLFNSQPDEKWFVPAVVTALDPRQSSILGTLSQSLLLMINVARGSDKPRDVRLLRNILQHLFQDITKEEGDNWVQLARQVESSGRCLW
jgi:E3 ubiquitin-protein ligase listerin